MAQVDQRRLVEKTIAAFLEELESTDHEATVWEREQLNHAIESMRLGLVLLALDYVRLAAAPRAERRSSINPTFSSFSPTVEELRLAFAEVTGDRDAEA